MHTVDAGGAGAEGRDNAHRHGTYLECIDNLLYRCAVVLNEDVVGLFGVEGIVGIHCLLAALNGCKVEGESVVGIVAVETTLCLVV